MKFIKLEKYEHGYYKKAASNEHENLSLLYETLTNGNIIPHWLIRALNKLECSGITANSVDTIFEGDVVHIEPLFVDNPENYRITLSRNNLFDIATKWTELVQKEVKETVISQDDIGNYSITETIEE